MKKAFSLIPLLGLLLPSVSSAALVAIDLTNASWTTDIVYGAGEPGGSVSGTMDNGHGFLGATWYGIGQNTAAPTTGLPIGPTVSATTADLSFTLRPFAGGANAVMLNGGDFRTLTLGTPGAFSRIALIGSTGNGVGNNTVTFNFADGSTQVFSNFGDQGINADWFGRTSSVAYITKGRLTSANTETQVFGYDNVDATNPRLYESIFTLTNTSNLVSVTVNNVGGGHTAIMAISGEAIPEPASVMLLGAAGALGLLRRRRA